MFIVDFLAIAVALAVFITVSLYIIASIVIVCCLLIGEVKNKEEDFEVLRNIVFMWVKYILIAFAFFWLNYRGFIICSLSIG